MKSLFAVCILSLSISSFAQGLPSGQASLSEIKDVPVVPGAEEVSRQIVSLTDLRVTAKAAGKYTMTTASGTRWNGNAKMFNVQQVVAVLTNDLNAAQVTVYQVDGNAMGVLRTELQMQCQKNTVVVMCSTVLADQNRLVLTIGR